MKHPFHVCLVCTGNTCRSPMSMGILRRLAVLQGRDEWRITSAGLAAFPGAPATAEAIAAAAEHGVDISAHRARRFDPGAAADCDVILVHAGEHLAQISAWGSGVAGRVYLLKAFPDTGDPGPASWVDDPIGGDLDAYRRTYLELDEALRRIFQRLAERAGRT